MVAITRKKNTGEPGNPGQFGSKGHSESTATLVEIPVVNNTTMSADDVKQATETYLAQYDDAVMFDGVSSGRAAGYAEVAATLIDPFDEHVAQSARELADDRNGEGYSMEEDPRWRGPGALDSYARNTAISRLRSRSAALMTLSPSPDEDTVEHANVLAESADELAGDSSLYADRAA